MNDRLTQVIIGKKNVTEKKNFVWNMVGSGIFSFVSMALSLCVIQIAGEKVGGVFSIAVTISQMMLYIAFFELSLKVLYPTKMDLLVSLLELSV